MLIREITQYLETLAPLHYQEPYDNAGLIIGSPDDDVTGALITLDVTEPVIDEAVAAGTGLIVAHHPVIFAGLKKLDSGTSEGRCLIKAIRSRIAIYAAHTNFDNVIGGVNGKIGEKLGLTNCRILTPVKGQLKKLVTFIPTTHSRQVREAVFAAGAGVIGNYDCCGYSLEGSGSFRGNKSSHPFAGQPGMIHYEPEVRFETIFPAHLQNAVLKALSGAHPYEEVAYDIYPLDNEFPLVGSGLVGDVIPEEDEVTFLRKAQHIFRIPVVKHSPLTGKKVRRAAVCGGSGSFLIRDAIKAGADVFLTGDLKYHQYFEAEGRLILADIGHFESEQFTKKLFYELLRKKFPTFALRLSEVDTNPINYLV